MANNTDNDALTAKVRAMYGRCLSQQNYRELIHKQTVSEVAAYLKQQTDYAVLLRDVNESLVHRGKLEELLRGDLFDDYLSIFHFVGQQEKAFYRFFIMRLEMNEVLTCVRLIVADRAGEYVFGLPSFFAKHASFDLYELAKVKDYDGLLRLLKPTPYGELLRKYNPAEGGKIDAVRLEIELSGMYFSQILKSVEKTFAGETEREVHESFGMQIDLSNMIDIIRLKRYFNAKSDYIRTLLLPFYFKARRRELDEMMEAPDAAAAWKIAEGTYYGRSFRKYNFEFVDQYEQQILYSFHKHLFITSMSAPVVVTAYLKLKEYEIQNIIHVIEGIRYGLAPVEIGKLLVGVAV